MTNTIVRLNTVTVAALFAVLIFGLSRPATAATEDTIATALYPGWNLVGWIHADAPVNDVFQQIPELESVHGEGSAHRDGPDSSGPLRELQTGRGYWFFVGGGETVEWIRPAEPATRRFHLEPRKQLVAWAGRSGMEMVDALAGIRDQLSVAWLWRAAEQSFVPWHPGLGGLNPKQSRLNRGDALWIDLHGAREWLQPSRHIHPVILEGNGAAEFPDNLQAIVEADLQHAADTVAAHFAFEIPPGRLEVRIPTTREAFDRYGSDRGGFAVRASGPGAPHLIVMNAGIWTANYNDPFVGQEGHGRQVMLHEFFHAVQFEASGAGVGAPGWLSEGTAMWFDADTTNESNDLDDVLYISDQLDLRELDFSDEEPPFDTVHYTGIIATIMLVERSGAHTVMDFWRNLSKYENDTDGWRLAFAETFGISFEEFADEFAAARRNLFTSLSGILEWVDGASSIPITVEARMDRLGVVRYFDRPEADGSFELLIPRAGSAPTAPERFELLVKRRDQTCYAAVTPERTLTWRRGLEWHTRSDHPLLVPTRDESIVGFTIHVPEGFCQHMVRVRIESASAIRDDVAVSFCEPSGKYCFAGELGDDEIYEALVPIPGDYIVALTAGESPCRLYGGDAGLVRNPDQALFVASAPAGRAVSLQWDGPESFCDHAIEGRFSGREGAWLERQHIYAFPWGAGPTSVAKLNADGTFRVPVPEPGLYRFTLSTPGHHRGGLLACELSSGRSSQWVSRSSSHPMEGSYISVPSDGSAVINWEIHPDACRYQVTGRITDEHGTPRRSWPFVALPSAGGVGSNVATDSNGDFVFVAPMTGNTRLQPGFGSPLYEQCSRQGLILPWHRFTVEPHSDNYVHWVIPSDACGE